MQNADNIAIVRPDVNGASWVGSDSAAVPTNAVDPLTGYTSEGWLTEDGITMTVNKETTDIKGFGGKTAISVDTAYDVEFKYKPMEWNETVAATMFGSDNVQSDGKTVKIDGAQVGPQKRVFEMMGLNSEKYRVVVPKMQLTGIGDLPFKHDEPMASELTFKALPDEDGVMVYIYKAEAAEAAAE